MSSDDWPKIKELFETAADLDPSARTRFLDASCGQNGELRREVESLLASLDRSDSFLEEPAANQVASMIVETKDILRPGDSFGHYKVVRRLGIGGMGEVYLAEDAKLDRHVAIKILNEQFGTDDSHLERFVREAKAASSLNHPNILVIHEIGQLDGANYIVSEFVDGRTLRDLIGDPDITLMSILDISIQIAAALDAAHEAGIAHRDIKPENIVVRPDGYVKVLDFGLAKLLKPGAFLLNDDQETAVLNPTAQGVIMGTVNYMSPEQAKAEEVDQRTDIFSLGVVIYELLTGTTPFQGNSMTETFANLINAEPRPMERDADVPYELERIVSKALQKNKADRYQTTKDLLANLKELREKVAFDEKFGTSHSNADVDPVHLSSRSQDRSIPASDNAGGRPDGLSARTMAIIGSLLIVAAIAGGYFFFLRGSTAGQNSRRTLAVLPFTNASRDPNAEYLADGVTESIINNLSQLSGLKVMSRNSAFRFKADQSDLRAIAAQLNVDTLVTGDVREVGDKVVINVRLTNASDDSQLWGNQYVRTLTDVITTQNEIAQAVAQNLKVQLTSADAKHLTKRYTENPEAYQAYSRGRFHIFKLTPDEVEQGIAYLQQAIDLDPNYAIAYAGLSDAYRSLAVGGEISPVEFLARSKAAARKAIEIDDTLSDGHAALGMTLFWGDWDWAGGESELKRALELNPNDVNGHIFYAHMLSNTGRHSEALAEIGRARELDPLFPFAGALEGQFLLQAGKPDEALDRLRKTFELAPNFWMPHLFASVAYVEKGMYPEAVIEARRARELPGTSTMSIAVESYALAKSGRTEDAKKSLDELLNMSTRRPMPATHIALAYNGLGDTQKALDWLEKAFAEHDPKMAFLRADTKWNNLRSEPRFIELMRRMNL